MSRYQRQFVAHTVSRGTAALPSSFRVARFAGSSPTSVRPDLPDASLICHPLSCRLLVRTQTTFLKSTSILGISAGTKNASRRFRAEWLADDATISSLLHPNARRRTVLC